MYLRGIDNTYPTYHSILKDIYADGLISDEGVEEIKKNIPEMSNPVAGATGLHIIPVRDFPTAAP